MERTQKLSDIACVKDILCAGHGQFGNETLTMARTKDGNMSGYMDRYLTGNIASFMAGYMPVKMDDCIG